MDSIKTLDVGLMATGCSVRCRHCYASAKPRLKHPIGAALAEEILDTLQPLIGRAERTLVDIYYDLFDHPDAPGMIRLLHGRNLYGYFQDVSTNGRGLANRPDYRQFLKEMRGMGSECLALTFHGLEENHDWFVRRNGAFKDLIFAAQTGRDAGLKLGLWVQANKRNVNELPALADYLAERGLWIAPDVPFAIFSWGPAGYALELESLRIDSEDAAKLKAQFKRGVLPRFRPERDWWKLATEGEHREFHWGEAGYVRLVVWGDHEVSFDDAGKLPVGNLLRDDLDTVLKRHQECEARQPAWQVRAEIWQDGKSQRLIKLAQEYGNREGAKMYGAGPAAMSIWLERQRQSTEGGAGKACDA